jgi:hypothetical protein
MKIEIDLDQLFAQAMHHMEDSTDLRWSVGMALEELYWDAGIEALQARMEAAFTNAQSEK